MLVFTDSEDMNFLIIYKKWLSYDYVTKYCMQREKQAVIIQKSLQCAFNSARAIHVCRNREYELVFPKCVILL